MDFYHFFSKCQYTNQIFYLYFQRYCPYTRKQRSLQIKRSYYEYEADFNDGISKYSSCSIHVD